MSTNVLKLIAGAAAALFILVLIGILSIFAFYGKTTIEPVVYQIGVLITTALGLITALAGHVAATSRSGGITVPPGNQVTYAPPVTVLNTAVSAPAGSPPVVPPVITNAPQ